MAASQNNIRISGRKLQWVWINSRDAKLVDEEGNILYYVEKLYTDDGIPVRDEKDRMQYQVHIGDFDGPLLDAVEPYMPTAKSAAESHYCEVNGGKFEGHWSKR